MDHPDVRLEHHLMVEALRVAARIPLRPWPNPPVGAVVVRDGQIVGRGAHHGAGTDHAEVVALREAGDRARGATLYCTLEPCNHHGRTPPCAPAVAAAGISTVVAAMADPNPRVQGGGLTALRQSGVETRLGTMASEALELVWPFVATQAFARPFVVLKTATSVDGFFAPAPGDRKAGEPWYLTGLDARRDVHVLRRWCDAVLVGSRTVSADAPRLDGRLAQPSDPCPSEDPVPACADTCLALGAAWQRPGWVFAGHEAAAGPRAAIVERAGGTVVGCDVCDGRIDPRDLVSRFCNRGGHVLLVEGGPTLAASFLDAGLVDRWVSYVAPVRLGSGVRWPDGDKSESFHLTRAGHVGGDARLVFDRLSFRDVLATVTGRQEVR